MNARTKIHQLHLNEWITRFSEQKASGLTVKQWCEQKHLSIHAYNYWKHLVKEDLSRQVLPDIVPLAFPNSQSRIHKTRTLQFSRIARFAQFVQQLLSQ